MPMKATNITTLIAITLCVLTKTSFGLTQIQMDTQKALSAAIQSNLALAAKDMNNTITSLKLSNLTVITHATNYKLKESLKPFGYFHAKTSYHVIKQHDKTLIIFHVTLGPPVIIKSFNVDFSGSGKNDVVFKRLESTTDLQPGTILNTNNYKLFKETIFKTAIDNGYFDASIKYNDIKIDLQNNSAYISISALTGKPYKIGDTTFNQTYYSEPFLNKYLAYKKGDRYNIEAIDKSQENFKLSPYFAQAIITPSTRNKKNNTIPIRTTLSALPRKRYTIGLGYDNQNKLYLTGTLYNNHLNNKDGLQLKSTIQISAPEKNIYSEITIPSGEAPNTYYALSTGFSSMKRPNGDSNATKSIVSKKIILPKGHFSFSLNVLKEKYRYSNLPKTTANMIYPSFESNYSQSTKINNITQNGYSFSSNIAGTINSLSHDNHFFQFIATSRYLHTFNKNNTRLQVRGSIGTTSIKNILNLPLSMQLYAGGAGSIRGYKFHSIPTSPARKMFTASTEIQQRIYQQVYATAFYDAGNVADKKLLKNRKESIGTGIAIVSPLGTFELSIAKPINSKNKKSSIQFSMEPPL